MPMRGVILFAVALTTLPFFVFLCAGRSSEANGLRQEDKTAKLAAGRPAQGETPDAATGKKLFDLHCAACHGIEGRGGGRGPNLNRIHLEHAPDDAALKSLIANGVPPEMPEAWYMSEKDVVNVVAYVRSLGTIPTEPVPGDATRGARIYAKSGCANCHIIAGEGKGFGPELTEVGARRSAEYLRECMVTPSTNLPDGFLWVELTPASGETLRGIRVNEDTFSIQVKDSSGGFHSLRKQELKQLRKLRGETPMPSYEKTLNAAELQDLVAYLVSLRGNHEADGHSPFACDSRVRASALRTHCERG
jgi:cytochrome c oxidase cbb3-type subunit III